MPNLRESVSPAVKRMFASFSRRVEGGGWTDVTFQNNWVNYDVAPFSTVQYKTKNGMVLFRGLMRNDSTEAAGASAFKIPGEFLPSDSALGERLIMFASGYRVESYSGLGDGGASARPVRIDVQDIGGECHVTVHGAVSASFSWLSMSGMWWVYE